MLADRYYMRREPFRINWSATLVLLVINVVVFLLQLVVGRFSHFPIDDYFALSVEGLRHGFVWQLLTYQFMHGNWIHLLLNCWAIYVFGQEVELTLGRKSFLTLYFPAGSQGGCSRRLRLCYGPSCSAQRWLARLPPHSGWWPLSPCSIPSGPSCCCSFSLSR